MKLIAPQRSWYVSGSLMERTLLITQGPFAHSAPSTAPTTAPTEPAELVVPLRLFHDHRQRWNLPPGTVQGILSGDGGTFRRGFELPDGSRFAESLDGSRIEQIHAASSYSADQVD